MANPIAMFNPKEFAPPPAVQGDTIIAGNNAGIKVLCAKPALETYNELVKLGKKGNHWARLIVSGISGLSSSRLGMDNVFTKKGDVAYGRGLFYVELPGVLATFESLDNGSFKLESLNIDKNNSDYFGGQKKNKNPGLWRVTLDELGSCRTKFVNNSSLLKKHKNRYVAISDTIFKEVNDAAIHVKLSLQGVNNTVKNLIEGEGFDMHFTPGPDRDDGLVNSKQALNRTDSNIMIRDSSQLLANTMYQSKDNENIQWFSDYGGSAVLTNAMKILSDQKVNLNKHTVFLNRPTTRPSHALELGRKLKLKPFEGGQTRGVSPREIKGHLMFLDTPITAMQRLVKDDSYTLKHATIGAVSSSMNIGGHAISTLGVLGVTGAVGASIAGAPLVAGAGAALYVTSLIIKAYKGRRKHN